MQPITNHQNIPEEPENQSSDAVKRDDQKPLPQSGWYIPRTLRQDLRTRGRLPVPECLELGLALTDALAHLHRHGLVHRDVKPSNIIFVNGVPKLADIGLVATLDEAKSFVGTEGYIPPEGPGAAQADLFSLGKVLYEISTGKDRNEFPEPLTNLGELGEQARLLELNAIIHKACRANLKERYPTAEAMRADLVRLQRGQSVRRQRTFERATRLARWALPVAAALAGAVLLLPKLLRQVSNPANLAPVKASVFVLPFRDAGTNGVDADLRGRITDAFIDSLALIEGVRRSPQKSGWAYSDEDELRHSLAKTNDMRHILTGRIGGTGDTLTLTLRLYERRKNQPLWTETISGKTNDIIGRAEINPGRGNRGDSP